MMFRLVLLSACVAFCGACICVPGYVPDTLCRTSILFRGAAIAEGTEGNEPEHMMRIRYRHYRRVFTVRVDQAFRMPASLRNNQTITIDPSSGTSCSTGFKLNVDTLFAAYQRSSGEVETGQCSPNTRWSDLSARSKQLLESYDLPHYCANLDTNKGNRPLVHDDWVIPARMKANPVLAKQHWAAFVKWFFSTLLGWERN